VAAVLVRDDRVDLLGRPLDLAGLVDHDVVVVVLARQLEGRVPLAQLELVGRFGRPRAKSLEQGSQGRWDHEDQERLADLFLDDLGSLDVDLEDRILAGGQRAPDLVARRAVPVAVDLVRLEEAACVADPEELVAADEVVVDALDLAGPRCPGRG